MATEGEAGRVDWDVEAWGDERLLSSVARVRGTEGWNCKCTFKGKFGGGRLGKTWQLPDFWMEEGRQAAKMTQVSHLNN